MAVVDFAGGESGAQTDSGRAKAFCTDWASRRVLAERAVAPVELAARDAA